MSLTGRDCICAPATPLLPSAVAIVRISGPDLGNTLEPLLRLPEPRQVALRRLRWNGFVERALVLYFQSPHSYTGEDLLEVHLHGNPLLVRRFLEHLGTLGIRLAEPGEFTRRALLNGKQGLLEAEALRDIVAAATDTQLREAQARAGAVPAWIKETRSRLAPWIARAEAAVDYGEEEGIGLPLDQLSAEMESLLEVFHVEQRRSSSARWLRDGIRVALVGRPNAGKSSLFNALAGEDRAIVTEIPGTTRDVLEVRTEWAGLPLLLFDTAGLRETAETVERLGVARVAGVLEQVDLILHLRPVGDPPSDGTLLEILGPFGSKILDVWTMGDRASAVSAKASPGDLIISVHNGDLTDLEIALKARFLGGEAPEALLGALATARQRELLEELIEQVDLIRGLPLQAPPELAASALQGAWGLLARLTGEDRAESALDQMFSGFCLGK